MYGSARVSLFFRGLDMLKKSHGLAIKTFLVGDEAADEGWRNRCKVLTTFIMYKVQRLLSQHFPVLNSMMPVFPD